MKFIFALIAAGFTFANATLAQNITLDREIMAGSLHVDDVDIVVYFVDQTDHYEVVTTYVHNGRSPARMRMALLNGDAVTLGLPDLPGKLYRYARSGDVVTVDVVTTARKMARAN